MAHDENYTLRIDRRDGEWECDYEHRTEIHLAFRELVATSNVEQWPHDLVSTALYAIARDHEVSSSRPTFHVQRCAS